jgi:hypothetical protein
MKELPIGITGLGVLSPDNTTVDLDTRFKMACETQVFDYLDQTPGPGEVEAFRAASERHGLPLRAGGFYYRLGRDDELLMWHLRVGRDLGVQVHNVQIFTHHADGHPVSNEEVADFYLRALELGVRTGVTPCLEVHVNMWSERFSRVAEVGELVERRGAPYYLTLDHSHVIFKIDNPREQLVQDLQADIASGRTILDPASANCVIYEWLQRNWIRHAHARATVPANPLNLWAHHLDGSPGRGIQYPFIEPGPGEWHSAWEPGRLEPWKQAMRAVLAHHARDPKSPLGQVTMEFIPFPDYGGGARYSIFANNIACAKWVRDTWNQLSP